MTDAKKLKQKIRARARKTGERYAAARRHVLAEVNADRESKTRETAKRARRAAATGAVSDERCIEKTGHGFTHWFGVLDRFGARDAGHTAAARHLKDDQGVSAWYAQAITVAYERAHGLREVGQLSSGAYQTSVSRVLPVDLDTAWGVFGSWPDHPRGLDGIAGEVVSALREALDVDDAKAIRDGFRLRYRMTESTVEIELRAKPDGRSTVGVRHTKITERAVMEAYRDAWRSILDGFRARCRGIDDGGEG